VFTADLVKCSEDFVLDSAEYFSIPSSPKT